MPGPAATAPVLPVLGAEREEHVAVGRLERRGAERRRDADDDLRGAGPGHRACLVERPRAVAGLGARVDLGDELERGRVAALGLEGAGQLVALLP